MLKPALRMYGKRPASRLLLAALLVLGAGCSVPEKPPSATTAAPSVVTVAPATTTAPEVKGKPVEYETEETQSVHVVEGATDWDVETRVRLSGAVWTFKPDGGFIFAPAMSGEDLFPINGHYRREGSHYVFEGTHHFERERMETGHSEVTGTMDFGGAKPVVQMRVTAKIGDGKVRENDPSSIANNFVYEATVLVKKAP